MERMKRIMMKEIEGLEGKYAVTDDGRVWSIRKEQYIKPSVTPQGYYRVNLCGKWHYVHDLVLNAFKPLSDFDRMLQAQEHFWECDHIDNDKSNNHISNLHWCDRLYNLRKREKSKPGKVREILDEDTGKTYNNARLAAEDVGCSRQTVLMCCHGQLFTANGHHLRFKGE